LKRALERGKRSTQLAKQHNWTMDDIAMADFLVDEPGPYGLHKSMYLITLRDQTNDEQKELFEKPAIAYDHVGCYAQTELGHGSNVRGLETTATWIEDAQEFEINTPTLTATKWWIGSLGRTANHAAVMCQLIVKGKNLGPHPFIVNIRDLKTHKPLKGVTVGDLGPKFGYNTMDNGFLQFDHVRVPHINMLAKYASIDRNTGQYIKPANAKLAYGTMTWVRSRIVMHARLVLARSATIAVRYCSIRRQFQDKDAKDQTGETPVINYSTVQYRLFPILAQSFALHYVGLQMGRLYEANMKQMSKGNFELLADLHATSSGLKIWSTTTAVGAIEIARRACGGHGFSMFSGLAHAYQDYLPEVTWEGDSQILSQQLGTYLLKTARFVFAQRPGHVKKSITNPTIEYLLNYQNDPHFKLKGVIQDGQYVVKLFGHRAAYAVAQVARRRDQLGETWNSLLHEIYEMGMAHCEYMLVKYFWQALCEDAQLAQGKPLRSVIEPLFHLFALTTLEAKAAEFFAAGCFSQGLYEETKVEILKALAQVRPNAVTLVDAFDFPDFLLQSSLGRFDGNVYPDMIDRASREPANASVINSDYRSAELVRGEAQSALLMAAFKAQSKPSL
jgi:acyl-CoA oxidase